ncbi:MULTISPECIES: heat-inducible transcriptional repressor HrcA [Leuconostoc]|uniref:Heat-inducible transcription repressor HrcA n=2 Tax=Leuconostoc TaxID=1243 RepID=A0AAN2UFD5_9LACO|nr:MULTISPECIES: heat-inducible transcriptional repressor HrcA [Leuconostoc]MBR2276531.1 heat-inducible transcription repressor HrcA [Leuconostoc sp.]MBZ5944685.1 heat-inducible transcription repressor HrcA [Leuconostoc gasicomitatum]MBZ5945382.1 heat-inducible transcription repressor HrcA [Leuconostoc gasicomitatum]MBZ5948004.1 heat-inducible transcription repressor HrcA [Leuconostoc gasicomitatum]MBZ5949423.1 heat-inducible transcription repressor HrcA [Leuconostoc gasicomitatum]
MLTERQKLILSAIIYEYTQTAHAVGSKSLQEQLNIKVSSATIRNEMAALESAALIKKLHTSAGRVPSRAGYRYYLDNLMMARVATQQDIALVMQSFRGNFHEIDDLLDESARTLSQLTGATVLILKPERLNIVVSGFRLVPLENQQLIAVLVTNDGKVTSQTFKLPRELAVSSLDSMIKYINDQTNGRPVLEVLQMMQSDELPTQMSRMIKTPAAFLQLFGDVLARSIGDKVHIGGRLNVLDFSDDDQNTKNVKQLLEFLTSAADVRRVATTTAHHVTIKIAKEIDEPLLKSFSLITRAFTVPNQGDGVIALLGPIRMSYARNVLLMDAFGEALSQKMIEYT